MPARRESNGSICTYMGKAPCKINYSSCLRLSHSADAPLSHLSAASSWLSPAPWTAPSPSTCSPPRQLFTGLFHRSLLFTCCKQIGHAGGQQETAKEKLDVHGRLLFIQIFFRQNFQVTC